MSNKNITIFLVDDDVLCLNLYAQFIRQQGFTHIHLFDNGDDCLEYLEQLKPAVVFLDYNMEGMNGLEVLRHIRDVDPSIIVVFISGEQDKSVAERAIEQGALDFVVKTTINSDRIRQVMERIEPLLPEKAVGKENASFLKRLFSN